MSEKIDPAAAHISPETARLTRLAHAIGEDTFGLPAPTVSASLKALRIAGLFPSVKDYGRGPLRDDAEEYAATLIVALGGARTIAEVVPAWERLSSLRATEVSHPISSLSNWSTQPIPGTGPSLLGTIQLALAGQCDLTSISVSQSLPRAVVGYRVASEEDSDIRRLLFFGGSEPAPVDFRFEITASAIKSIAASIAELRQRSTGAVR